MESFCIVTLTLIAFSNLEMLGHSIRSLTRRSAASLLRFPFQAYITHNVRALPRPCSVQTQFLSTPAPRLNESHLSMEKYHTMADHTMEELLSTLEDLLDSVGQPDWEVDYHSGVLTLRLGSNGTYVVNKQPPNKQIWLSSPRSGPKRYDFHEDSAEWVYSRDGKSINALLSEELSMVFTEPIHIRV